MINCTRCAHECTGTYLKHKNYEYICRLCHKQLYALKRQEAFCTKNLQEDVKWLHGKLDFADPIFLSKLEHDREAEERLTRLYWFANS